MLKRLTEPFTISDHVLHIGASAGVAIAPNDGKNVDELIANADLALYQAKSAGRRSYRFFLPVLRAQAQARASLDIELRRAYAENEFELYFQPQIRLADGAVIGAEALLRWRHPVRRHPGARHVHRHARGERDRARGRPLDHPHGLFQDRRAGARRACRSAGSRSTCFPPSWPTTRCCTTSTRRCAATGLPAEALELEITENVALDFEDAAVLQKIARPRHQARIRRFRHRLCLAQLSDPLPALAHQDRPQLHRQDHRRRRGRRDRALAHRDGAQSRASKSSPRAWRRPPRRRSC